jgi:penicillin-binding protein 1A
MALIKWGATAAVWVLLSVTGLIAWYATDLPDVDKALTATRQPTVRLAAASGAPLAAFGEIHGPAVRLDALPGALVQAVLATEDRRFFHHYGIDPIGLVRAVVANVRAGRIIQGASTITQQLAKNLFLTPERTLKRKVQELLLALWLENKFTKHQILSIYLNRVYLGAGVFGVEAAARHYFGRPARSLSLYQAAMLAGSLKAPSRYNPARHPDRVAGRTAQVLANMVDAGAITPAEARAAKGGRLSASAGRAGRYFAGWVMKQVGSYVSPGDHDLGVRTTLDLRLQGQAEALVEALLAGPGAKADVSQAAVVVLAPSGAVRAMVGGRDHGASQFNRATQALRQPGSAFKPVVYLAGLESGLEPASRLVDAPVAVGDWRPRNFDGRYRGAVSLREALAGSINTVAVTVAEQAGRENVVAAARRLGLSTPLSATPSLALGAAEVSLIELTGAYGAFATGGIGVWPHGISEISDGTGRVLYRRAGSGPGRVMELGHASDMTKMLASVVNEGTGRGAALAWPAAGKTGTSQDFRDAWFVGYTAQFTAGVWMGNDDGRPMKGVTGSGLPARLWHDIMLAAHEDLEARPLPGQGGTPDVEQDFWKNLITHFSDDR